MNLIFILNAIKKHRPLAQEKYVMHTKLLTV